MNRILVLVLVAIVAAGIGAGAAWYLIEPEPTPMPEPPTVSPVPEYAADFALRDLDGTTRAFSEWDGRIVVVNFWATWCAPCRREIPVLVDLQAAHDPEVLTVLGVAVDEDDAVREYVEQIGMTYTTLVGQLDAIETARAFGNHIGAMPYTVIVGPGRRIHWIHAGEVDAEMLEEALAPLLD
jgi:thiol-disulfide isomerase/thioredoxin